jgi:hypothetical protein
MKRLAFATVLATLVAASGSLRGQGGGNPFIDHSDTGETVHVLPTPAAVRSPRDTQPTDAPRTGRLSVYAASYGSGSLTNHGGPQLSAAGFYAVYYNSAVANSAGTQGSATLRDEVQAFVSGFAPSTAGYSQGDVNANYSIVTQYGTAATPIDPSLWWAGDTVDTQAGGGTLSDSKVQNYLAGLFSKNKITNGPNESVIYGIYFPAGTKITLQGGASCSSFCGYHGHFSYNGKDIKYAVFPYTDCRACSLPGKGVADIITIVTSHEIREAVTDPRLNSWFDAAGYEADDKCAWHNLYQTATGNHWVQPEYSNGGNSTFPGPGCVVPR